MKRGLSKSKKKEFSDWAYNTVKPINNTVSFYYTDPVNFNGYGIVCILDRDSLCIKEEGTVVMTESQFIEHSDRLISLALTASEFNKFRYSRVVTKATLDSNDVDFEFKSTHINDPDIIKDLEKNINKTLKDIYNVINLTNGIGSSSV